MYFLLRFFFWCRSFCSCLVKPATGSDDLKELVAVNLEFQVCMSPLLEGQLHTQKKQLETLECIHLAGSRSAPRQLLT